MTEDVISSGASTESSSNADNGSNKGSKKLGLIPLIALIVGSSIGGGIFNATTGIAKNASAGIAIISWLIVGAGIMLLVLSINNIIKKRPELDGGLVEYADKGFGKFWGLTSGWGYWLSAWLGNVAFAALLLAAFGGLYDGFALKDAYNSDVTGFSVDNILPFLFVSLIMWGLFILVSRGVESAAFINAIVLVAKFVPLILVAVVGFIVIKGGLFTENFWKNVMSTAEEPVSLWDSISGSFIGVMIWCFVGIEGAAMFGNRAKNQKQVAKATNIGFIVLLVVYILLSILPFGVYSQAELAELDSPSLGYVLKEMFGGSDAGLYIVNIGLIISLIGAWISWTMLPVQTLEQMSNLGHLPKVFAKRNKKGVPMVSLLLSTICCQAFMLIFLFPSVAPAGVTFYDFGVILCGNAILITWFITALFNVKISIQDRHNEKSKLKLYLNIGIGCLAAAFQILMMYVTGWAWMSLMFIAYVPAFIMFVIRRQKEGEQNPLGGLNTLWIILLFTLMSIAICLFATGAIEFAL